MDASVVGNVLKVCIHVVHSLRKCVNTIKEGLRNSRGGGATHSNLKACDSSTVVLFKNISKFRS